MEDLRLLLDTLILMVVYGINGAIVGAAILGIVGSLFLLLSDED